MNDDRFAEVAAAVLARVEPDAEERARLAAVVETLTERTNEVVADLPVEAEPLHVGSTARDTWIAGDRDVDLFVRFSTDLPRADLERLGLDVGHAVLPDGHEEYAEHPYVTGEVDGFAVDLVPCYAVDSATEIRTAVDRTPFHTDYLKARLDAETTAEIRVFKQFLKGVGVYGSDLRTRGFSGYLTELLVLAFGDARSTLDAVSDWHPPVVFDPEEHGTRTFDDPLVVVDPTDPERNVAAVLSAENLARLQHHARAVLADPAVEAFFPHPPAPISAEAVREHLRRRETTPVAVVFETPDVVDDDLYPQLRRSLSGVGDELDRRGFSVFRRATFADSAPRGGAPGDAGEAAPSKSVLLFELSVAELPAVECHEGPPVHVREHAAAFYETYADDPSVYGPFVGGERYVVEREREFTSVRDLLESDALFDVRLGTSVAASLRDGYDVVVGEDVATLADAFGEALSGYFDPRP